MVQSTPALVSHEKLLNMAYSVLKTSETVTVVMFSNNFMDSSFLFLPLIIFGVGFLILLVYYGMSCMSSCLKCHICVPQTHTSVVPLNENDALQLNIDRKAEAEIRENTFYRYMIVASILGVICNQLQLLNIIPLFTRSPLVVSGYTQLDTALTHQNTFLSAASNSVYELSRYTSNLESLLSTSDCCRSHATKCRPLYQNVSSYAYAVGNATQLISSVYSFTVETKNTVETYIYTDYLYAGMVCLYLLPYIPIILIIRAYRRKSRNMLKQAMRVGSLVYLVMISLSAVWLVLLSVIVNMCHGDQVQNVMDLSNLQGSASSLSNYLMCDTSASAIPPVLDAFHNKVSVNVNSMDTYVSNLLKNVCSSTEVNFNLGYFQQYVATSGDINVSLTAFASLFDCQYIRKTFYSDPMSSGICISMFEGILFLWFSEITVTFFILAVFLIANVLYGYLDETEAEKVLPFFDDEDEDYDSSFLGDTSRFNRNSTLPSLNHTSNAVKTGSKVN